MKVHEIKLSPQGCCRWACQKTFLSLPGASVVKAAELQVMQVPCIQRYVAWPFEGVYLMLRASEIFFSAVRFVSVAGIFLEHIGVPALENVHQHHFHFHFILPYYQF